MDIFPETLYLSPPELTPEWKTLITDFESGAEQRRKVWAFPRRTVKFPAYVLTMEEIKLAWQFYQQQSGAYGSFWLIVPLDMYLYGEFTGRGDGAAVSFDLPGKETDEPSLTVYVDGVETAATWLSGGGQAGADRIEFAAAPADGAVITADFYGKLRLKARFSNDRLSYEAFAYLLFNMGMDFREVR